MSDYFYFRKQNEGVKVVIGKDQLLELRKFLQLIEILMIDYQVKSDILHMNLFNLIIEFRSLEHLQSISKNVKNLICFNFGMPTLNKRLYIKLIFNFLLSPNCYLALNPFFLASNLSYSFSHSLLMILMTFDSIFGLVIA